MSESAALVFVDPERPPSPEVHPQTMMLGLPILRRSALAARKAGFDRILVAASADSGSLAATLADTGAEIGSGAPARTGSDFALPWNRVVDSRALRDLRQGRPPSKIGFLVENAGDLSKAEDWLLARLVKDTEGFMSRHFERKVSLAMSRRLAATRITPNQMTLVSVAIGLVGAPFFFSPRPLMETLGALLFLLHSIVDGCDGELARLKLQESRRGGILDFWGDNVVHIAVFASIAVGWSLSSGARWPLLLGAAAVAGTLASAGFAYHETMRGPKEGPLFTNVTPSEAPASRVVNALARRDFIYVVLALSLFGKANWFLVLAAFGAPAFFLALVLLGRRPEGKSK
ncbi:MAG TPA: CDP-alcohol phosphatidyltransferase family protein [Thermoanaerobaculia bacterium]